MIFKIHDCSRHGPIVTFIRNDIEYYSISDICRVLQLKQEEIERSLSIDGVIVIDEKDNDIKEKTTFINEDILYKLILLSETKESKKIKDIITSNILPKARRYGEANLEEVLDDPEYLLNLFIDMGNLKIKDAVIIKKLALNEFKVKYFDRLVGTKNAVDFKMLAKDLNYHNISKADIIDILRTKNVLQANGLPYQKFIDQGYFISAKTEITQLGFTKVYIGTIITSKGKRYIKKIIDSYLGEKIG